MNLSQKNPETDALREEIMRLKKDKKCSHHGTLLSA